MRKPIIVAVLVAGMVVALPAASFAMSQADRMQEATEAREAAQARAEKRKIEIEDRKAEVRERVEAKKAEVDARKCERNQERINAMMPRLAQSAVTQQRVLDTMYERVVGFYEKGTLSVDNYEELVADVETAKAETADVLQLLGESEVEVDCEADGIGGQLALYREAVGEVRNQLKVYRSTLVELIKSMNAATTEPEDSTFPENEAASENEVESENESENETETETESESEIESEPSNV